MDWAPPVEGLVRELSRLPGVGRRSAQRLAHHLLRCPEDQARALSEAISNARDTVRS